MADAANKYPENVSGKFYVDVGKPGHRQGVDDAAVFASDALIFLNAQQDMGGCASIGNEHRPL